MPIIGTIPLTSPFQFSRKIERDERPRNKTSVSGGMSWMIKSHPHNTQDAQKGPCMDTVCLGPPQRHSILCRCSVMFKTLL